MSLLRWAWARPNLLLLVLITAVFYFSFDSANDSRHELCRVTKGLVETTFQDDDGPPAITRAQLEQVPQWRAADKYPEVQELFLLALQGGLRSGPSATQRRLEGFADSLDC